MENNKTIMLNGNVIVAQVSNAWIFQQWADPRGASWRSLDAPQAFEDVIDVEALPIGNVGSRADVPADPADQDARERPGVRLLEDVTSVASRKQQCYLLLGRHVDVYV
jgi:hypothetical protein